MRWEPRGSQTIQARPGGVTADHIEASTSGLAAGIINDGVQISNYYGGDGPAIEPIRWQGRVADAPPSVLNVAPLARTRPKTFATYVPRDQDDEIRTMLKAEPFVVLGGPPLAGKTRTLTEIAKDLFRDATVIVPDPDSSSASRRSMTSCPMARSSSGWTTSIATFARQDRG